VHPGYIMGENIPSIKSVDDLDDAFYHARMDSINEFEKHIAATGTIVLKFFLNLSKEEQKKRLLRRLNLPEKNWKFSPGDLKERKLWDQYQDCYEDAINRTSKGHAPWYIVPADDKPTARAIVANTIYEVLKSREDIVAPELPKKYQIELENYKKELNEE
jgi:polyphosphate kinase 2 (PPK2 family)